MRIPSQSYHPILFNIGKTGGQEEGLVRQAFKSKASGRRYESGTVGLTEQTNKWLCPAIGKWSVDTCMMKPSKGLRIGCNYGSEWIFTRTYSLGCALHDVTFFRQPILHKFLSYQITRICSWQKHGRLGVFIQNTNVIWPIVCLITFGRTVSSPRLCVFLTFSSSSISLAPCIMVPFVDWPLERYSYSDFIHEDLPLIQLICMLLGNLYCLIIFN